MCYILTDLLDFAREIGDKGMDANETVLVKI